MSSVEMNQLRQVMKNMMQQQGMTMYGGKMDYAVIRQTIERASAAMPAEPGVSFTADVLNGIEAELLTPENPSGESIVLYIHGGGLVSGNVRTSRGFASQLASESGLRVYTLSYRLAPEHPYPAANDDCFAVYQALLEKYPRNSISFIGDSGGAYLSLVTTIRAMEKGLRLPASVTLYSPLVDFTGALAHDRAKFAETDFTVGPDIDQVIKDLFIRDADVKNPCISPIYADYKGFPPLKIVADSGEVLVADADILAETAKKAGVEVEYRKWDETFHAFATTGKGTPESAEVLQETVAFINKHGY
ncbi:esterase [Spirochaetia bacterium]|nr:esterase [Spirochaetia bacterium]